MRYIFSKAVGLLLLVALSGCTIPSSGGYGNPPDSSSGHHH